MNSALAREILAVFAAARELNERYVGANEGGYSGEGMLNLLEPKVKDVLAKHGVME